MTNERMEFLAKAATDSFMANLEEQDKKYLLSNKEMYVREYLKVFDIAMAEIVKKDSKKFEVFGTEDLGKSFK